MLEDYDICPKCGQKLLPGAMKCLACNATFKTEEDQKAMIRKFLEPEKGARKKALIKFAIYLLVFGIVSVVYSEEIRALVQYVKTNLFSR